jgi:hypothetical protein
VSFLTAPEWTSTNDSEEQMNFSCQSSGFAGILPFATHPPLSRFRVNGSHQRPVGRGESAALCQGALQRPFSSEPGRLRPGKQDGGPGRNSQHGFARNDSLKGYDF